MLEEGLQRDIDLVARIDAVPRILEVVCRSTGMGFAAVARVTDSRWVCCSVRDEIAFGLQPGDELPLQTTICHEVRQSGKAVVIDHVAEDAAWSSHHIPAQYGFQSYISLPILRGDGSVFGTLCAIDPRPARLRDTATLGMFELFAQLIGTHLDAMDRLDASESELLDAHRAAELREQFIAVLGHDLRNPLQAMSMAASVLAKAPERTTLLVPLVQKSLRRMSELVDNLVDFARARLGGGMVTVTARQDALAADLQHVVEELAATSDGRTIDFQADLAAPVTCDRGRIAQMLSNLLGNALRHGDPHGVITVRARSTEQEFELSVANGGRAIPEDARKRLFEPFFRGPDHARSQEGLGLGLFIVGEIARAHGGTVDVSSNDQQTRFTFRMPQRHMPTAE